MVITAADLAEGTLPADSLVKIDRIYTLSKSIIIKRYGMLNETYFQKVLVVLDSLLGRIKAP